VTPTGTQRSGWAELFAEAFARSANPMMMLTRARVIVAVNAALRQTFRYEDRDLVGHVVDVLIAPSWQERALRDWGSLLHRGRLEGEREWLCSDRSVVHVEIAAAKVAVEGRDLILCVVLESKTVSPVRRPRRAPGAEGKLTPREREIVSNLALGYRVHEIADKLYISPSTARTHIRNAMDKLGARSQAQLVAIAFSEGLIDPQHVEALARR